MEWFEWAFLFMTIIMWTFIIVKEYKEYVNRAPDGKKFIKKFLKEVEVIQDALRLGKIDAVECCVADPDPNKSSMHVFSVSVKDDKTPEGLKYATIPIYKSRAIYIGDEPVCRIHNFNRCDYLEFSYRRDVQEVIDIVERASKAASKIRTEARSHLSYDLSYETKSFYQ